MKIITSEHGTKEKVQDIKDIKIPDIWNIAMQIPNETAQQMVLEVWHLAIDFKGALLSIAAGANRRKPIHTKDPQAWAQATNKKYSRLKPAI